MSHRHSVVMMQTGMIRVLFSDHISICDCQHPNSVRSINIVMCNYAECARYAVDIWRGTGPLELLNRVSNLPRFVTVAHISLFCNDLAMILSSEQ
jgi:hypothetical protein